MHNGHQMSMGTHVGSMIPKISSRHVDYPSYFPYHMVYFRISFQNMGNIPIEMVHFAKKLIKMAVRWQKLLETLRPCLSHTHMGLGMV